MSARGKKIKATILFLILLSIGILIPSTQGQAVIERIKNLEETPIQGSIMQYNDENIFSIILEWLRAVIHDCKELCALFKSIVGNITSIVKSVFYLIIKIPQFFQMLIEFIALVKGGPFF